MQESPTRIKPKRAKKVEVEADTQQEIPGLADASVKSKKSAKSLTKSELIDAQVIAPELTSKRKPRKVLKEELEPQVIETSSAQVKSNARGRFGKARTMDPVEKNTLTTNSKKPIENSSVQKTRRVSSRSKSAEDVSKSQKTDSRVSRARRITSSKKEAQAEMKDDTGTLPTSSDQGA